MSKRHQNASLLSRYAAAVFHSVQVVEVGLIELGEFIGVDAPHSGWTAVSTALDKIIAKKHRDRTEFERNNFKFLEQMQGTVAGLKNAWRNKISHAQGDFCALDEGPSAQKWPKKFYSQLALSCGVWQTDCLLRPRRPILWRHNLCKGALKCLFALIATKLTSSIDKTARIGAYPLSSGFVFVVLRGNQLGGFLGLKARESCAFLASLDFGEGFDLASEMDDKSGEATSATVGCV